ncbi:hypothetical protein IAU60_001821 [Kwoniella sp. DSM 27419]
MASPEPTTLPSPSAVDIDAILWHSLQSTPMNTLFHMVIAAMLQAMVVSSIMDKTGRYYEYFRSTDRKVFLGLVGLGCLLSIGALGVSCAQIHRMVFHVEGEFHRIFRSIFLSDQTTLLYGGLMNLSAGCYYGWRTWLMLHRQWWVVPLLLTGLLGNFAASLLCAIYGIGLPSVTLENLDRLGRFFNTYTRYSKIWGGLTLGVDAALCACLTCLLLRSKESVFHREKKIFRRLMALMYESMLPPVVFLLVLECTTNEAGSPTTDWRKFLTTCTPCLYFHSVVSALVGRQTIRDLLDAKLVAEGVIPLSITHGSSSGARSHVRYPYDSRSNDPLSPVEIKDDAVSAHTAESPVVEVNHDAGLGGVGIDQPRDEVSMIDALTARWGPFESLNYHADSSQHDVWPRHGRSPGAA